VPEKRSGFVRLVGGVGRRAGLGCDFKLGCEVPEFDSLGMLDLNSGKLTFVRLDYLTCLTIGADSVLGPTEPNRPERPSVHIVAAGQVSRSVPLGPLL